MTREEKKINRRLLSGSKISYETCLSRIELAQPEREYSSGSVVGACQELET